VLTWLTDLDPVKIEINVPERFVGALKIGQPIEIKVAAYPGKKFKGEIYFISQQLDPTTRTVLIKGKVPNPDSQLKPGMFANLDLTVAVREKALVIPERGLSRVLNDNKAMVFIVDDKSKAQMRPVKLGIRLAGEVEIVEGLQPGEKVIVEGLQKIGPGSVVKVAAKPTEKESEKVRK